MPPRLQDRAVLALLRIYGTSTRCLQARHASPRLPMRQVSSLVARSAGFTRTAAFPAGVEEGQSSPASHGGSRRSYASSTSPAKQQQQQQQQPPREIAVLGGGLTGLTTAYYLNKFVPSAKVTVYEASDRLGGWVDSQRFAAEGRGGSEVKGIFERGPRAVPALGQTNRYDDLVLYELVQDLGLQTEMFNIPRGEEGLPNQYIYYPDHLENVKLKMPTKNDSLATWVAAAVNILHAALTRPIFKGAPTAFLNFVLGYGKRSPAGQASGAVADESIGDWLLRRTGRREPVDNMVGAMMHGIYGGDVWKLSVFQSPMQSMWLKDNLRGRGKLVFEKDLDLFQDLYYNGDAEYKKMVRNSMNFGLIGFNDGFGTLTDAITRRLKTDSKVKFKLGEPVTDISYHEPTGRIKIKTSKSKTGVAYDKVISTILAKDLYAITDNKLPSLRNEQATSIMLVNLFYPRRDLIRPHRGFGYLVPSSVAYDLNPEGALGVIFDSDHQDFMRGANNADEVRGTKLTVMLGGHHWDWLPRDRWPSRDEAVLMGRAVVARHLGIAPDEPLAAAGAKLCWQCIPQQHVGHTTRMQGARGELERGFRGGLAVAGPSYTPPGVLPSLRAGRDAAMAAAGKGYRTHKGTSRMTHVGETGLGQFRAGGEGEGEGEEADDGGGDGERVLRSEVLPFRHGYARGLYPEDE